MLNKYASWIVRWPWLVIGISVVLTMTAGYGVRYVHFKNDYRMFFSEDNPQLRAFEALEKTYTRDDNILVVVTPQDGDVFTSATLAAAEQLTKRLWHTPYATRVNSLANFQHSTAEADELFVGDLVHDAERLSQLEFDSHQACCIERAIVAEPLGVTRRLRDGL